MASMGVVRNERSSRNKLLLVKKNMKKILLRNSNRKGERKKNPKKI